MDPKRAEYIETCKAAVTHALENNKILIHYVRDFNFNRVGVLVASILDEEATPSYGWSMCHPKKDKFNKYVGISKAMERMVLGCPADDEGILILPPLVLETMPEFEKRVARYFKLTDAPKDENTNN